MKSLSTSQLANSKTPSFVSLPSSELPGKGDIVALDAEFVALEVEQYQLKDGTRVISKEDRKTVARVSIIDGRTKKVIIDDYVLPTETVVDYLTRFSGLSRQDLDPLTSLHNLISSRASYMKVRYLLDKGCIIVGHGLKK